MTKQGWDFKGTGWRSAAASVALHVAVGVAMFATFATGRPTPPPELPAMSVQLATMPSAPPAPPDQTAPGVEQVETRETLETRPEQVELPPIPVALAPDAAVVVSRRPDPAPPRPAADPEIARPRVEQTSAPAAVALPSSAIAAAPVEGTPTVSDTVAQQTWEGRVLARIERRKRYPREAQRAGEEDSVYVRIAVDRSGRVVQSSIVRSRGFARLDEAALDQIRRAGPFPPPPSSTSGSVIRIVVTINFNL